MTFHVPCSIPHGAFILNKKISVELLKQYLHKVSPTDTKMLISQMTAINQMQRGIVPALILNTVMPGYRRILDNHLAYKILNFTFKEKNIKF